MNIKLNILETLSNGESSKMFLSKLGIGATTRKDSEKKKILIIQTILYSNWFANVFKFALHFKQSETRTEHCGKGRLNGSVSGPFSKFETIAVYQKIGE